MKKIKFFLEIHFPSVVHVNKPREIVVHYYRIFPPTYLNFNFSLRRKRKRNLWCDISVSVKTGIVQNMDWTGLDNWTGQLDWTIGLDSWTGLLDLISNGIFSIK